MKSLRVTRFVLLMAAVFSAAAVCHAQNQQAFFTATVMTQVTATAEKTVVFTNASIINAVIASGSFPGLKAKDCAIVMEDLPTQPLDVIDTTNDSLLVRIGICPNNSPATGVEYHTKTQSDASFVEGPFTVTLPGVVSQTTNLLCKIHHPLKNSNIKSFLYTFVGGNNFGNVGATLIQGTIKSGPKLF